MRKPNIRVLVLDFCFDNNTIRDFDCFINRRVNGMVDFDP